MNALGLNYENMRLFLEGKREGKIVMLIELCAEGLIGPEIAADRLNMTIEAFLMLYDRRKPPGSVAAHGDRSTGTEE